LNEVPGALKTISRSISSPGMAAVPEKFSAISFSFKTLSLRVNFIESSSASIPALKLRAAPVSQGISSMTKSTFPAFISRSSPVCEPLMFPDSRKSRSLTAACMSDS